MNVHILEIKKQKQRKKSNEHLLTPKVENSERCLLAITAFYVDESFIVRWIGRRVLFRYVQLNVEHLKSTKVHQRHLLMCRNHILKVKHIWKCFALVLLACPLIRSIHIENGENSENSENSENLRITSTSPAWASRIPKCQGKFCEEKKNWLDRWECGASVSPNNCDGLVTSEQESSIRAINVFPLKPIHTFVIVQLIAFFESLKRVPLLHQQWLIIEIQLQYHVHNRFGVWNKWRLNKILTSFVIFGDSLFAFQSVW